MMTSAAPTPRLSGRRSPDWASEFLQVLDLRRPLVAGVAVAVSLVGVAVAALAPAVLSPRPLAGVAVGLAACLLAVAAAVAVDAGDRYVRGPRHVRGTGASLAAVTGREPSAELVAWVDERMREEPGLRLALAGPNEDGDVSVVLARGIGTVLARQGWRVLIADLAGPPGDGPGILEVCRGDARLGQVVTFHPTLQLAVVGPGSDPAAALTEFPGLAARLPRDVDGLLVALPGLHHPGALPAAAAADRTLLLALADRTSRVQLIAALDALDEAGLRTDVVLVDDRAAGGEVVETAGRQRTAAPPSASEVAEPAQETPEATPIDLSAQPSEAAPAREDGGSSSGHERLDIVAEPPAPDPGSVKEAFPPVVLPDVADGWQLPRRPERVPVSDDPDAALRAAASLDALAHEIWSRDEDASWR